MLTVHEFLKVFPSSYWKTVAEDTPLRTIKTLLHTLAKVIFTEGGCSLISNYLRLTVIVIVIVIIIVIIIVIVIVIF